MKIYLFFLRFTLVQVFYHFRFFSSQVESAGIASSITGSVVVYSGGGGGSSNSSTGAAVGGVGGGGNGATGSTGSNGSANTGGGGGAAYAQGNASGSGGSGIVIIRYPSSYKLAVSTTGSPTQTTANGYIVYTFTSSGSITF